MATATTTTLTEVTPLTAMTRAKMMNEDLWDRADDVL